MQSILSFSASALLTPLLIAALLALAILVILGWRHPHLVRIALRNVPRRRTRTALIVVGLMFATMFVAAALVVDDTITQAVQSVAVFNLGRIDEDVTGGDGPLGLYDTAIGTRAVQNLSNNSHLAGIAPALVVQQILVADASTRQVRGNVTGFALDTTAAGPLGDLRAADGAPVSPAALAPGEILLNRNAGTLLGARPGDTVDLTSIHWLGQQGQFRVRAIVHGGPLGDAPSVVLPLPTLQGLANAAGKINHIYVANAGDGLTGLNYSHTAVGQIRFALRARLRVADVKFDGVTLALQAQQLFGRILTLYTLFALAIGLLLIFLIFVLLAAERRAELGMTRALGMRRSAVVEMLLFEGAAYDAAAAALGIALGLALATLIIAIVSPILRQIGYPLQFSLEPQSLIVAFGIGFLFTLVTIWCAAWTVSRMTVAAAMRDLPEPPRPAPSLLKGTSTRRVSLFTISGALLAWGLVPAIVGWALALIGTNQQDALIFSLGLSALAIGVTLLLRWFVLSLARSPRVRAAADRGTALVSGGLMALYWSLPFDALAGLGLPRFSGAGIQIFFIAGCMMVFGTVWALAPNLDLLLIPVRAALDRLGRFRHVGRIALVYPAYQRFRTGIGLAMFGLVCFTMVVMACIAASTTSTYDNLPAQAAGYDVIGQPLFTPLGDSAAIRTALQQAATGSGPSGAAKAAGEVQTIASASPLLLGIIQPGAPSARWQLYPAAQIDGAFLNGVGLPLAARAAGFTSDAAVWRAVRDQPGDVVIDAAALTPADAAILGLHQPGPPDFNQFIGPPVVAKVPGFASPANVADANLTDAQHQNLYSRAAGFLSNGDFDDAQLRLTNIAQGAGAIAPTTLWVGDLRGGPVTKLRVVGIVENARGQRYGLFGSPATFAPVEQGRTPFGNQYYYFQVRPGIDPHQAAQSLGSTLFTAGFETTVLQDILLDTGGPRIFISRVLVGLVGLTLLVGMAALAVTGSRAVVERRQQIGMLRALGFRRWQVQLIFLIESLLIGALGTVIGLVLGLVLCRNIFAVNFFDPIQSGLVLVVPWAELVLICAAAVGAAAVAALLPAWQAGRVAPADALRYE